MEFYKRVLKLHQFRNLGKNLPTELLLNSSFEKHGGVGDLGGGKQCGQEQYFRSLEGV